MQIKYQTKSDTKTDEFKHAAALNQKIHEIMMA